MQEYLNSGWSRLCGYYRVNSQSAKIYFKIQGASKSIGTIAKMYYSFCLCIFIISTSTLHLTVSKPLGRSSPIHIKDRIDPLEILREGRLCLGNDKNCNPEDEYERDEADDSEDDDEAEYDDKDSEYSADEEDEDEEEDYIELEHPKHVKHEPQPVKSKSGSILRPQITPSDFFPHLLLTHGSGGSALGKRKPGEKTKVAEESSRKPISARRWQPSREEEEEYAEDEEEQEGEDPSSSNPEDTSYDY